MDRQEFVEFVRARGLAVVSSVGPDGAPQAALVGVAATDQAEIVFDTTRGTRKFANLQRDPRVALVIGWEDEVTVQCEGTADVPTGEDRERCLQAYFKQYPDGRPRAEWPDIVHVRVRPRWLRLADYRPNSSGISETVMEDITSHPA